MDISKYVYVYIYTYAYTYICYIGIYFIMTPLLYSPIIIEYLLYLSILLALRIQKVNLFQTLSARKSQLTREERNKPINNLMMIQANTSQKPSRKECSKHLPVSSIYYTQVFPLLSNLSIFQVMSLQKIFTLIKISKQLQMLVAKF